MDKSSVKTKEDLIIYLNKVEGLPFLEDLWELCVQKAEENKDKEIPIIEKTKKELMVGWCRFRQKYSEMSLRKKCSLTLTQSGLKISLCSRGRRLTLKMA